MTRAADVQPILRALPSVDGLLLTEMGQRLSQEYGRSLTVEAIRQAIEVERAAILKRENAQQAETAVLLNNALAWLQDLTTSSLQPVINATGVIVHTNLGRAPLSQAALAAIAAVGAGYSTLEYEPGSGQRGSRSNHPNQIIQRLLKCEASFVVNNNAAGVLLMLTALCQGKEVIISRGQLVEIGGGFRIPDVMAQSGAKLVEVGTTNRTHLRDYQNAINENTAAILVAHHSNYKIVGFTSEPSLSELANLAQKYELPLLYDQGSGALLDSAPYGLPSEPTVPDGLAAGCDVVAFSGDKLLGGPQAGILCGRADLIASIKRHPLARAVRADKFCLAGLSSTLLHYIKEEALSHIPVWQMISRTPEELNELAVSMQKQLSKMGIDTEIIAGVSTVGGGSLPGSQLKTWLISPQSSNPQKLAKQLRMESIPVVTRLQDGRLLIDPRTLLPQHIENLYQSLLNCSP